MTRRFDLPEHATTALTWMALIAGVTIVGTAFMLAPASCVDQKAEVIDLKRQLLDAKTARLLIDTGTCVTYESVRQQVCRQSGPKGGKFYLKDLSVDGEIVSHDG